MLRPNERTVHVRVTYSLKTIIAVWLALAVTVGSAGIVRAGPKLPDVPSDQVVVKPKPGVDGALVAARYGATVTGVVTETNLYLWQLPAGQAADALLPALNADPDLFYAEPNYYADAAPGGSQRYFGGHGSFPASGQRYFSGHGDWASGGAPKDQWAWKKIGLSSAQSLSTGQGVIVAIIDSGIDLDHPALAGALLPGYDFVGMDDDPYDRGDGLDNDGNGLIDEGTGHGTHMAGIVHTLAPGAMILPVRVLNSDGIGTYWEVAAGIRYAVDHGARVINLSMSATRLTPSLSDALNYAIGRGVVVVAAAGDGEGANYPAAFGGPSARSVLGVGATDSEDRVAAFSGGKTKDTDVFAPGVDIFSTFANDGYASGAGTSMSAAFVSGEAALLIAQHPEWNAAKVSETIAKKISKVKVGEGGNKKEGGEENAPGRINLTSALGAPK